MSSFCGHTLHVMSWDIRITDGKGRPIAPDCWFFGVREEAVEQARQIHDQWKGIRCDACVTLAPCLPQSFN